jgi:hypothetical protein
MNPPILPWHREAAIALAGPVPTKGLVVMYAAIISRHDPHAAQHADCKDLITCDGIGKERKAALLGQMQTQHEATVRLLEQAILGLDLAARRESPEFLGYVFTADAIRAHLAKLRGEGGAT